MILRLFARTKDRAERVGSRVSRFERKAISIAK